MRFLTNKFFYVHDTKFLLQCVLKVFQDKLYKFTQFEPSDSGLNASSKGVEKSLFRVAGCLWYLSKSPINNG